MTNRKISTSIKKNCAKNFPNYNSHSVFIYQLENSISRQIAFFPMFFFSKLFPRKIQMYEILQNKRGNCNFIFKVFQNRAANKLDFFLNRTVQIKSSRYLDGNNFIVWIINSKHYWKLFAPFSLWFLNIRSHFFIVSDSGFVATSPYLGTWSLLLLINSKEFFSVFYVFCRHYTIHERSMHINDHIYASHAGQHHTFDLYTQCRNARARSWDRNNWCVHKILF